MVAWLLPAPANADFVSDCFSTDNDRRIAGCTELLDRSELSNRERSMAHAMRALAYSLKGNYKDAMPDYDRSIELDPTSAIAYNNRAWVHYRIDDLEKAIADVERAIALSPASAHAYDTRAHIRQKLGLVPEAIADYMRAIRFGGERMVKLYQCGLQAQGFYDGPLDGRYTVTLAEALGRCTEAKSCDPLPPDEECRNATS